MIDSHQHVVCIPILSDGHWSPVVAMPYHDKVAVWTTSLQAKAIREAGRVTVGDLPFEIFECVFPHRFPADCGFQTIGWFISMSSLDNEFRAITDQLAAHWRMLFHQHLTATQTNVALVTSPLQLGGASTLQEDLIKLITEHGVSQSRSHECAVHIIATVGVATVQKLLKAPKPWTDLKARASLCRPPIRIVLPEELQAMLQDKADAAKPVGKKHNKNKLARTGMADIRLKADQIMVPPAVFKQQDGSKFHPMAA